MTLESSSAIVLEPVSETNYEAVFALDVQDDQRDFITPNVRSVAQAYVYERAEPYAIRAGQDIVGFTMLYPLDDEVQGAVVNLVRFMIDRRFQRQGLGMLAIREVIRNVAGRPGARVIQLSVYPRNLAAIRLYEAAGFVDTGQVVSGENVYRLRLRDDLTNVLPH